MHSKLRQSKSEKQNSSDNSNKEQNTQNKTITISLEQKEGWPRGKTAEKECSPGP